MALDPSIALGVKSPEPVDFTKFAQLRNLGTHNALMEAQLPGTAADSQMKQFDAQKQADIKRLVSENTKLNEDGTRVVDDSAAIQAIAKAGYLKDAQGALANHYANISSMTTTEEGKRSLRNNLFNDVNTLGEAMNQANPGSGDKFVFDAFSNTHKVPELHKIVGNDPRFKIGVQPEQAVPQAQPMQGAQSYPVSPGNVQMRNLGPNGQPIGPLPPAQPPMQGGYQEPQQPPTFNFTPGSNMAVIRQKLAGQGPEVLAAFDAKYGNQQPAIPTNVAVKSTLPQGQQIEVDKNRGDSVVSKQARAVFDKYDIPYEKGATYNELSSSPQGQRLLEQQIPTREEMNAAATGLQLNKTSQMLANNAATAGNALMQSLPPGLSPSDLLAKGAARLTGNANWNNFLRGVEAAQAAGIPNPTDSIEGGLAAIRVWQESLKSGALKHKSVLSGTSTSKTVVPEVTPTGEIPSPETRNPGPPKQFVTRAKLEAAAKARGITPEQLLRQLPAGTEVR